MQNNQSRHIAGLVDHFTVFFKYMRRRIRVICDSPKICFSKTSSCFCRYHNIILLRNPASVNLRTDIYMIILLFFVPFRAEGQEERLHLSLQWRIWKWPNMTRTSASARIAVHRSICDRQDPLRTGRILDFLVKEANGRIRFPHAQKERAYDLRFHNFRNAILPPRQAVCGLYGRSSTRGTSSETVLRWIHFAYSASNPHEKAGNESHPVFASLMSVLPLKST